MEGRQINTSLLALKEVLFMVLAFMPRIFFPYSFAFFVPSISPPYSTPSTAKNFKSPAALDRER
jgi:hypothetical protein